MHRRTVLASSATALGGGLAGCIGSSEIPLESWTPGAGSWPLPRYDTHNTAYNPNASPPLDEVTRRWEQLNYGSIYGLVGRGDIVVAFGESGLWGFDVVNGEERWSHDGSTTAAAIYGDRLYTCGQEGLGTDSEKWVRSVDLESGDTEWEWTEDDVRRNFVDLFPTDEYVFVSDTIGQESLAFERADGNDRWTVDVGGMLGVADDQLLVSGRGSLDTFAIRSGWISNDLESVSSMNPIPHSEHAVPVYTPRRLLLGQPIYGTRSAGNTSVHAYDRGDGERQWTSEPRGSRTSSPAIVEDVGFVVQSDGESASTVVSLDLVDGRQRWYEPVEGDLHLVRATDEIVLVAGEIEGLQTGVLTAFDHDGTQRWEARFNGRSWDAGVIAMDDAVFVGTDRGEIVALEAA